MRAGSNGSRTPPERGTVPGPRKPHRLRPFDPVAPAPRAPPSGRAPSAERWPVGFIRGRIVTCSRCQTCATPAGARPRRSRRGSRLASSVRPAVACRSHCGELRWSDPTASMLLWSAARSRAVLPSDTTQCLLVPRLRATTESRCRVAAKGPRSGTRIRGTRGRAQCRRPEVGLHRGSGPPADRERQVMSGLQRPPVGDFSLSESRYRPTGCTGGGP